MLSLPKIMLFLAIVAGVFLLTKAFRRGGAKPVENDREEAENKALDLKPCAVCGDYVSEDGSGCERDDCPIAKR